MLRVSPNDWLNELRATELPQSQGPGNSSTDCQCALTLALKMSGQPYDNHLDGMIHGPTSSAMIALIGLEAFLDTGPAYHALVQVYNWNDSMRMSFAQIADQFEQAYPQLLTQLQAEYDALEPSAKFTPEPAQ